MTMFTIGIITHFEAAHRLRGDFGPATRRHGHTYRVEVNVRGPSLRDDGTLLDLGQLQRVVETAVGALHYRDLDELEALAGRNTTAEALAQHLFAQIAPALKGQGLTALAIRLWESPHAYASYEASVE